jgi:hypothetical protein
MDEAVFRKGLQLNMGITTRPRRERDHNEIDERTKPRSQQPGSLIDIRSHYFVSYLVLHSALKEMMGGSFPPGQETAISNAVWCMTVDNQIPFSQAKAFADEKRSSSKKRFFTNRIILDSWWENAKWNMKNRMRRKP